MKRHGVLLNKYLPYCCRQNRLYTIDHLPDGYKNEDRGPQILEKWLEENQATNENQTTNDIIVEEENDIPKEPEGNYILGRWLSSLDDKN